MSEELKDLDILFPDNDVMISFTGKEDKKKYTLKMFLPHGLSLFMAKKSDMNGAEKQIKYVSIFLQSQYPHMDEEWVEENVSLQKQTVIFGEILKEVGRANTFLPQENQQVTQAVIMEMARKLVSEMMPDIKKEPSGGEPGTMLS